MPRVPDSEIIERFIFHPATEDTARLHELVRTSVMDLALAFNDALPPSREASLALTALQEAMMWANAAIAIHATTEKPPASGMCISCGALVGDCLNRQREFQKQCCDKCETGYTHQGPGEPMGKGGTRGG